MAEKLAKRNRRAYNGSTRIVLALVAALAALLIAWFVPLPRLVLSDEEKAAARMPQDRSSVASAQASFQAAETQYKSYVGNHDVGGAINSFESALHQAKASPADSKLVGAVQNAAGPVLSYMAQLHAYALAGESYFAALSHYDDELMAWTRSLGSESDALQQDTWPIVEYLKEYPPPVGESGDYVSITAAQVATDTAALQSHLAGLSTSASSHLDELLRDAAAVRADGRSVEYQESLAAQYNTLLSQYDKNVQVVATGSNGETLSTGRAALAVVVNLLLGAICCAGVAAIFLARRNKPVEEPR